MDPNRQLRNPYTFSNLFNLESLMNFQLPQPEDEFDYYANSSHDESTGGQADRCNGILLEKRKRRNVYSCDEDQNGGYSTYISEERYRAMLGEHVHKYKKRHNNNLTSAPSIGNRMSDMKSSLGLKDHKGAHKIETTSNYRIPPTYEMLAASLNLPRLSEIRVEFYLKGTLDLGSLASMMVVDKRFCSRSGAGMGEPKFQYESLQARLKAQSSNNSPQKFNLKVSDIALDSYSILEEAAGGIRRSIMLDGGTLQVFYVKVLEKGDTLPKKQKVNDDPSMIEKEQMNKIGKYWVNMVRKDIPKHHRVFIIFHRKQLTDAKRFAKLSTGGKDEGKQIT
ncbi:DBINO domain-containing protein [Cynara cardunculus var. scolymus]|uniref:DBINO domain-containing protein n=1 Tax=Cynara cardunculus var. scolymus TaxID=59895 RepID=A0A118IGS9_CYNCS|nr:DBINO domain-containing protein [Cynara cardunculus var. scolymus]